MGKTILITGVAGFLGSHIAKAQVAAGNTVIGIVRSSSDLSRLVSIHNQILLIDVDSESLAGIFAQGVDAIIHTATCYGRDNESLSTISKANIEFPLSLLEAALVGNVPAFLNTDSFFSSNDVSHTYLAAYAASKRQFAEWGRIACSGRQMCFVNIRMEHLYGPGDHASKFVSWVVRECLDNVRRLELTPGEQKRDFIYVDDAAQAFDCVLNSIQVLGPGFHQLGLGTGTMQTMRSFVEKVHKIAESTTELDFGALPYRNHEQMESVSDNTYLKKLGWENRTGLEEGIRNTVMSMRRHYEQLL
jgi:CDP-paratose synthetase